MLHNTNYWFFFNYEFYFFLFKVKFPSKVVPLGNYMVIEVFFPLFAAESEGFRWNTFNSSVNLFWTLSTTQLDIVYATQSVWTVENCQEPKLHLFQWILYGGIDISHKHLDVQSREAEEPHDCFF